MILGPTAAVIQVPDGVTHAKCAQMIGQVS